MPRRARVTPPEPGFVDRVGAGGGAAVMIREDISLGVQPHGREVPVSSRDRDRVSGVSSLDLWSWRRPMSRGEIHTTVPGATMREQSASLTRLWSGQCLLKASRTVADGQ